MEKQRHFKGIIPTFSEKKQDKDLLKKEFQRLDNEMRQLVQEMHWRRIDEIERQRHWFQGNVGLGFGGAAIFAFVAETALRPVISIGLGIFAGVSTAAFGVTAVGAIAGGLLGYYSRDEQRVLEAEIFRNSTRREKIRLFEIKRNDIFFQKLKMLEEAALEKWKGEVDFIMNPSLGGQGKVDVSYGEEITLLLLSDKIEIRDPEDGVLEEIKPREDFLMDTLRLMRKSEKLLRWGKVDLNQVDLTAVNLRSLIEAGLGDFEIRELILSHNSLEEEGLRVLHNAIVLENKFRNLKKLSLKNTALFGSSCLSHIQEIVAHLSLESLDVSECGLLKNDVSSRIFLKEITHSMVSLQELRLNHISCDAASPLSEMLVKAPLLKYADLYFQDLPFTESEEGYRRIFHRGTSKNISLERISIVNEKMHMAELDRHKTLFKTIRNRGESQGDALIDLLNFRLKGQEIPSHSELSEFLEGTFFSWSKVKRICAEIQEVRGSSSQEQQRPVSREELVSYIKRGVLPTFCTG